MNICSSQSFGAQGHNYKHVVFNVSTQQIIAKNEKRFGFGFGFGLMAPRVL
jgi:hypothetical protein